MALFFPDEFIQDVADKNDIVSVVSQFVKLKRSGSTLKGLCPFHQEKTPSFTVSPDKQLFYCFGCSKGGTVIHFIMQLEHLDFVEAVTYLAEKAGIPIPDATGNQQSNLSALRQQAYKINQVAGRFFYDQLMAPQGKVALEYALGRGLTQNTINRFGLGFAPEGNHLLAFLTKQGFTHEQMLAAGVVGKSDDGRLYDRFRGRLMFPIIDVRKNVVGFGGRMMGDGMPKYLNSPETAVFSKSYQLFGLNFAKASKDDFFILVEGYMDVIALHQNGILSAVATLGTALTPEQARMIKRMKAEVVIAYDSDQAGQNATKRAIQMLTEEGLMVRVLTMPGSKDPDEYIKTNGAGAFRNLILNSQLQIEYKISKLKEKYDLTDTKQKVDYISQAAQEFAAIKSPVEQEIYVKQLAEQTGVSADSIFAEVRRLQAPLQNAKQFGEFRGRPSVRAERKGDAQERVVQQARALLLSLVCQNEEVSREAAKHIRPEDFPEGVQRQLFEQMLCEWQKGSPPDPRLLVSKYEGAAQWLHDDQNIEDAVLAAKQAMEKIAQYRDRQAILQTLRDESVSSEQKLERMQSMLGGEHKKGGAE